MTCKVIYPDGTLDTVKFSTINNNLIKSGKIVAFQYQELWVELRRKQNKETYIGPERRKCNLPIFDS